MMALLFIVIAATNGALETKSEETSKESEKIQLGARVFDELDKNPELKEIHQKYSSSCYLKEACRPPWILIAGKCILADMTSNTNWDQGRVFCKERHQKADLAVFHDANEFAEILEHLRTINAISIPVHFWIGGSDEQNQDYWLWVNGKPMPRGSPFWGRSLVSGDDEPNAGDGELCAVLYHPDRYFIHDYNCKGTESEVFVPLCQYQPY